MAPTNKFQPPAHDLSLKQKGASKTARIPIKIAAAEKLAKAIAALKLNYVVKFPFSDTNYRTADEISNIDYSADGHLE